MSYGSGLNCISSSKCSNQKSCSKVNEQSQNTDVGFKSDDEKFDNKTLINILNRPVEKKNKINLAKSWMIGILIGLSLLLILLAVTAFVHVYIRTIFTGVLTFVYSPNVIPSLQVHN